jgi:hypothetical protein
VPVNRIAHRLAASLCGAPVDWHYMPLLEIEQLTEQSRPHARLVVEDDQGGQMYTLLCSGSDLAALKPYIQQLADCAANPIEHDIPLLPVTFDDNGRPHFCAAGAAHDFPENAPTNRLKTTVNLPPNLTNQIRTTARSLGLTSGELVLTAILKQTSKSG